MLTLVRETEVDPKTAHYQDDGYARLTRELIFDTIRECCEHRKFQKIQCPQKREMIRSRISERSRKNGGGKDAVTEEETREFIYSTFFTRAIQSIGVCPEKARSFLEEILAGQQDQAIDKLEEHFFHFRKSKISEQDGRTLRHVKKNEARKQA